MLKLLSHLYQGCTRADNERVSEFQFCMSMVQINWQDCNSFAWRGASLGNITKHPTVRKIYLSNIMNSNRAEKYEYIRLYVSALSHHRKAPQETASHSPLGTFKLFYCILKQRYLGFLLESWQQKNQEEKFALNDHTWWWGESINPKD